MPRKTRLSYSNKCCRMFSQLRVWFLCVFFLTALANAEHLPIKTYTVADGLLRDMVLKIKQDSRGFLWFCTVEGISRYDGYGFVNFRVEDGLPDRHVNDFLETSTGIYLIATDKGLARLNPKNIARAGENPLFTVYLPDDAPAQIVKSLFEDRNRTVWVGTNGGLYRFVEAGGSQYTLEKFPAADFPVLTIIQDRRDSIWIGSTLSRLFRLLPDGRIEQYSKVNDIPDGSIVSLLEDAEGRIWVGMRPGTIGGLLKIVTAPSPDSSIIDRHFTIQDGLPSSWIMSLLQSSDGKMWVGTTKGLCLWQGENEKSVCRNYTSQNDICDFDTTGLAEDRDGNLWLGSRCGTKKITRHGFTTYNQADNLPSTIVRSIFEDTAGKIFADSVENGYSISRFDDGRFKTVKLPIPSHIAYFGWGWKQWGWQDSAGAWWIPTGEGLYRSPPATDFEKLASAKLEEIKTGAKRKEVFRLFEDSRNDIWIAAIGGGGGELFRWDRKTGTWHDETQKAGFSSETIASVFAEDRSGNLWIATGSDKDDSRLIRYRDGKFRVFTEAEGSPTGWTRDLFVDEANRLWLANTANGLLRLDDVNAEKLNFARYSISEGLSTSTVYCVTGDEFGRIYVGTGRGLDRLTTATGQIENFTTADGLPDSFIEIAYRDRQKHLWFGTNNGLVRFQPAPEKPRQPPTVLITGLQAGGHIRPISLLGEKEINDLQLAANENSVRVEFTGLGATLGENLRYEYRLGDEDGEWISTKERTVNFANLAAGEYQFAVRAANADKIHGSPAFLRFKIAAPVWRQWWFILLTSGLLVLAVYLIYRNRLARLLEMERMRTRIATDLHDDIGANLTRISLLSEVARQGSSGNGKLLYSIAEIARESVASMNDIVWAISPDQDRLLDLTRRMRQQAEEVFAFRDIELDFNTPVSDLDLKLSVGVRRDLLLIFKEAVNNAARHSECTKVEIDFSCKNSVLSLSIKDNGAGFNIDAENEGQGLRSMSRRAAALGGQLTIDSRPGQGTYVKFELLLQKVNHT